MAAALSFVGATVGFTSLAGLAGALVSQFLKPVPQPVPVKA